MHQGAEMQLVREGGLILNYRYFQQLAATSALEQSGGRCRAGLLLMSAFNP